MLNVVIFGAPGSGKGTQSENIINRYGLHHISTGEVLRKEIDSGSELGKIADSFISKGNLIPDELMLKVLETYLDRHNSQLEKGIIFDGFPRTVPQAVALEKLMGARNTSVHAVIGLDVPEDELIKRMIERGRLSGRADDTPETIKNRLDVYHKSTAPLKTYYTDEGKYYPVNGHGDVMDIFGNIALILDKLL